MKYLVYYSGGILSYATLRHLLTLVPKKDVTCLFTDTKSEDPDLYRFLVETTNFFDVPLVWLAEGRTVWQVMHDNQFLANSRLDLCSRVLKREVADKWVQRHCDPASTTRVFGLDWSETERVERLSTLLGQKGWRVWCPLAEKPYRPYETYFHWLKEDGIPAPALYKYGFTHNNCGGFCVKAGKKHFRRLLNTFPERYAYHENEEARLLETQRQKEGHEENGRGRGLLRHQESGILRFITLAEFRQMEEGPNEDADVGSCGCFLGAAD